MEKFNFDKEDCRHYIGLLQTNINRMAANSANCKTWLTGIITASIALAVKDAPEKLNLIFLVNIAFVLLFYFLDSFYLGLEKRFILLEKKFIGLLKSNMDFDKDIYVLSPRNMGSDRKYTWKGMKSYSTWPFYLALLIIVIALYCFFSMKISDLYTLSL